MADHLGFMVWMHAHQLLYQVKYFLVSFVFIILTMQKHAVLASFETEKLRFLAVDQTYIGFLFYIRLLPVFK